MEAQASEIKPPDPTKPQQTQPGAAATSTPQVSTQFTPVVDVSGVEKSAVYRINPDNTVETLWSSKEENVYDLLALEKQILFSTDQDGRIYGLAPDRRVTLVTQTNEGETTRLLPGRSLRACRHRQHGPPLPPRRSSRPFRLLRSARARFQHRLALGQHQLARRHARLQHHPVPHALRQLRQARPHLERLERARDQRRRQPHHQPQRALHPVEGRDDRRRRRHAHPQHRDSGLSAAEFAARAEEHQRDHPGRRHHASRRQEQRQHLAPTA